MAGPLIKTVGYCFIKVLPILIYSACSKEVVKRNDTPALEIKVINPGWEELSPDGGKVQIMITSSYIFWKIYAKGPDTGESLIVDISPSYGGSENKEGVETEVIVTFQRNFTKAIKRQEILFQALDGGKGSVQDTVIVLVQEAGNIGPSNVNLSPDWNVEGRIFLDGPDGAFDEVSVKDPSIVFFNNKYHLFFTGRDSTRWRMGYATSSTLPELINSEHIFLGSLDAGSYFAAPQVFWYEPQSTWYLVYQSGVGASFSTNPDIGDPDGWSPVKSMGFGDGIDFWCISNGDRVYIFYSAQDGSRSIKRRSTSEKDFPFGWSEPNIVATNTFEAVHVYKNLADDHFYMIVEDLYRHQELWETTDLGGTWNKLEENWAHKDDLNYLADHWTDQVSHVELIRSGVNELLEVDDLNHCQMLIQGVVDGNYGDYSHIPYDLGVIRNY